MIVETTYYPNNYQLAEEIWNRDAMDQAVILEHFLCTLPGDPARITMQLTFIADELKQSRNRDSIIYQLENLLDNLKVNKT